MQHKIAAVQLQDIQDNNPAALEVICKAMNNADSNAVNVLCFPECFLQGYTLDEAETRTRAINLTSNQFNRILDKLSTYKVTIVLGVIEEDADAYFNTAVIIKHGKLLGKYRKVHLFETNFQPGSEYPVFSDESLTFGVNICYDARFAEGAAALATKGAQVIFHPLNNRLPTEKAIKYRGKHIPNLIDRAKETGCWIVSSDVIAQDESHIGYGCTAIVSPGGKVVARATELEAGMVTVELT